MTAPPLLIIGTGGHARECVEAAQAAGRQVAGLLDQDSTMWGKTLPGVPVLAGDPAEHRSRDAEWLVAVGDNDARARLATALDGCAFATLIHPFSWVSPSAVINDGCMIFAGTVLQTGVRLGRHVIINTGATVSHDCQVGDCSHVAVGAHLAGNVGIGARVLFGAGAVARPGVAVGDGATIGAGAVVVQDVAAGVTAVGGGVARPRKG
ncbi:MULTISPECIES: acetyltransferase [unclassified Minwuia]|jgi:sugar O-acyltransferase (sialic acid O-acetyltransferase NeuD family)|uniref:acetyltransferase n=1 Tax=unclassified Minwuia TaxID=2618799 RepID=UPI00247B120F|nr:MULTISPECIES: acetyltransferase [unclassified Minwuia]